MSVPDWLRLSKSKLQQTARSARFLAPLHQLQPAAKLASFVKGFMATEKQIEANRRNAQKSTGPRTPEGKAAVKLNALRHGMRARTVVLPGEDRQEFNRLCDTLEGEWQPRTATELFYLEQMAVSQWKLTRMEVGEADVYHEVIGAKTQIPLLDRIWKAQHSMERSFARAQRELERIQSSRPSWDQQPEEDLSPAAELDEPEAAAHTAFEPAPPPHVPEFPDAIRFSNAANFPPKLASRAALPTAAATAPSPANEMFPEVDADGLSSPGGASWLS